MFDLLKNKNSISMKEAEKELQQDPSIVLVDVRSRQEYRRVTFPIAGIFRWIRLS